MTMNDAYELGSPNRSIPAHGLNVISSGKGANSPFKVALMSTFALLRSKQAERTK